MERVSDIEVLHPDHRKVYARWTVIFGAIKSLSGLRNHRPSASQLPNFSYSQHRSKRDSNPQTSGELQRPLQSRWIHTWWVWLDFRAFAFVVVIIFYNVEMLQL